MGRDKPTMPSLANLAYRSGVAVDRPDRHASRQAEAHERQGAVGAAPHVLHVFPSFDVGGAQMRFAALAEGLGDRFSHTVISLTGNYEAAKHLHPAAPIRLETANATKGSLLARLRGYSRQIADLKPDLLVTYNWGAIEWAAANAFTGTPHIHIEDGFGPEESTRQIPRRIWARRLALRRSTVVVPSMVLQTIAGQIWRLDPALTRYIPNGVEPMDQARTDLDSLGLDLPSGLPRIVWAGALRREKNPIRLLRAFAPLKDQAVLIMIGEGSERAAIDQEIDRLALGPHVRLLGHRTDARDLIMQCQVMALSSDTEQMPLTILEAMDAGLPVASIDVGDVRNMVAPSNRPFVTPMTEDSLTGALQALIGDATLRAAIGRDNRARLRAVYGRREMVRAYQALFDGLIKAPSRAGGGHV